MSTICPIPTATPKAWRLDGKFGYPDLLANLSTRVRNTQIYEIIGPVTEIKSSKPQLVIVDCADGDGTPLEVLVKTRPAPSGCWASATAFGDASGSYGGLPRVTARYTYTRSPKVAE